MKLIKNFIFITLFTGSMVAYCNSIVIGVARFAPPYSSMGANNHFYGFSIDVMNEICKRLNGTCVYKAIVMDKQLDALDAGDIDITLSPRPIPQEKQYKYLCTIPYMISYGTFVTLNPNIRLMSDLKNKKVGVFGPSHIDSKLLPFTKKENIKEYDKLTDLLAALKNNELDAILLNANLIRYFSNNVVNFHSVGDPISLGNGYGIVALPKNADLIKKINEAILQIENDGTYEIIYSKYFGSWSLKH